MDIIVSSPILQRQLENVLQGFTADDAQTQRDLPLCQQLEDLVRKGTFVNWVQHILWAVGEEHITQTKEKKLALHVRQGISALRTLLPLNLTLAPRAITVPMAQSMLHNFHAVKAFSMALRRV